MIQIKESHIKLTLHSNTKKEVIKELLDLLECADREVIYNSILEREFHMSTAIGKGVALPRYWGPLVKTAQLAMGRKIEGIDFESLNQNSTNLLFLLLIPEKANYPAILSHLLQVLSQNTIREELLKARDKKTVVSLLHKAFEFK